jgi:hypothetical protein
VRQPTDASTAALGRTRTDTPEQGASRSRGRRALVVCRGRDGAEDVAVQRAVRRAGYAPVVITSASTAYALAQVAGERATPFPLLVVDADLDRRGDGLDLAISVAFEWPRTAIVVLHRRDDDTPDPALGVRLADLRCPVLRRPVRADVLALALDRAVRPTLDTGDRTTGRTSGSDGS